jgi:hypothetical protein
MFSARIRRSYAGGHALADQRGLQFCHGADDGEHRPPHWAVRVDLILDADEADTKMVEFFQGHQQMPGAAGEAIELPDQDAVNFAVSCGCHEGIKFGSPLPPA